MTPFVFFGEYHLLRWFQREGTPPGLVFLRLPQLVLIMILKSSHNQNREMKVSKGQSQPEIVAGLRLLSSLHGSGITTILLPNRF